MLTCILVVIQADKQRYGNVIGFLLYATSQKGVASNRHEVIFQLT
jgi:hypothetical protein